MTYETKPQGVEFMADDKSLNSQKASNVLQFHTTTKRPIRCPYPPSRDKPKIFWWPRLVITNGSLEALKWMALLLMTVDHINKFLFNGTDDAAFAAGRIALPLFIVALTYNLARPDALKRGVYLRTIKRLALCGVMATPALFVLGGIHTALRPLNIMFALLALTATLNLLDRRTIGSYAAAAAVFLVGGANVEYWWPALAFGLAVSWYCKRPGAMPLILAITTLASFWFINNNHWALMALPIVLVASRVNLRMPRLPRVFYFYYPIHLFALCLIRVPMSHAGYLFF